MAHEINTILDSLDSLFKVVPKFKVKEILVPDSQPTITVKQHELESPVSGLTDLASLLEKVTGEKGISAMLPEELVEIVSAVTLTDLTFTEDVDGKKYTIALKWTGTPWIIIPNLVEIQDPSLSFNGSLGKSKNSLSGEVKGVMKVGDAKVDASMTFPDYNVRASLSNTIALESILEQFHLESASVEDVGVSIDKLKINKLSLIGSLRPQLFLFELGIIDVLTFERADIKSLVLALNYMGGAVSPITPTFFGEIDLVLGVHTKIQVEADYAGAGQGWQFTGGLQFEEGLKLVDIIHPLEKLFLGTVIAGPVPDAEIDEVHLFFDTHTKEIRFTCKGKLKLEANKELQVQIDVDLKQIDGKRIRHLSGHLVLELADTSSPQVLQEASEQLIFDLVFDQKARSNGSDMTMLATYSNVNGAKVKIGQLVSSITNNPDILAASNTLNIELKDAFLIYQKMATGKAGVLLGVNIGGGINLGNLPLVGKMMSKDRPLGASFQPLVTTKDFTKDEIDLVMKMLPEANITYPQKDIKKRFDITVTLETGDDKIPLELPLEMDETSGKVKEEAGAPNKVATPDGTIPADDGTKWVALHKDFGPAHFERIGLRYKDAELSFLLDASLSLGGMTLSLDGLGVHSKIDPLNPTFTLSGLGLDYKSGPVEIGGAFLRKTLANPDDFEFDGLVTVKTEALALSALGSYAKIDGDTSLFVYAILDYPLGGPSFFFVTGLAAGFGYNRALLMPDVSQVGEFPLVKTARGGAASMKADELPKVLDSLSHYIPPKPGQYFLTVGIKFTSFQLIDSFAMLAVSIGNHFELDLLGISSVTVPTPLPGTKTDPLAEIELAIKASFIPDEGFLGVQAQLTDNSYILSRKCKLTGGFAFFSWFKGPHEGDFVLSVGGYHPQFKVPSHYPKVPRLGFNWQVDEHISIKGGMYYAMTASAMMAGGNLHAVWAKGALKAVFDAGADFLISWKPYHYDAHMYVHIAGTATFWFFGTRHITAHVGADLHIWGPEFAGTATVDLSVTSFTVRFGAARPHLKPIDWPTFKESFLPKGDENDWLSLTVVDGLLDNIENPNVAGENILIVNPKELELTTNSIIPITETKYNQNSLADVHPEFGIAPMDLKSGHVKSELTLTVEGNNEFKVTPIFKKAPVALWGESIKPDLHGKQFIEDTVSGYKIEPSKTPHSGESHPIEREKLLNNITSLPGVYNFATEQSFKASSSQPVKPRATLEAKIAQNTLRDNLLEAVGFNSLDDVRLNPTSVANSLLMEPEIVNN